MKTLMMFAVAAMATILFAQTAAGPIATPSKGRKSVLGRRISPEMKAKLMARTGGMVVVRSEGQQFAFINTQKRVPLDALKMTPATIERVLNFPVILAEGEAKNVLAEAKDFIDGKIAACVLIADDATLPSLLVAPESHYAIVNTAALAVDKPTEDVLATRTRKEMWRAFAYVMGAAHSTLAGCLMQGVNLPSDLDKIPTETICPEPFQKINTYAQALGIQPNRRATYRKACMEGWAPAPQTDMQKQIVEEVKAQKEKEAAASSAPAATSTQK